MVDPLNKQLARTLAWTSMVAGAFALVYAFWNVFYVRHAHVHHTFLHHTVIEKKQLGFSPGSFDQPAWAIVGIALMGVGVGLMRSGRGTSPAGGEP
jgi:hypothetical protein